MQINYLIKSIRPYQWSKNLLIFLPTVLAHNFNIIDLIIPFLLLSLTTSSIYLINDLNDKENDRNHPRKKHRPIAQGKLKNSYIFGFLIFSILLSIIYSFFKNNLVIIYLLFFYFTLTSFYSFYLKKIKYLDTICLSVLFCFRIFYGGIVGDTFISNDLIIFSLFFFCSLALSKRLNEIQVINSVENLSSIGRPYSKKDQFTLFILGVLCNLIAIIVFVFYSISEQVEKLYNSNLLILISSVLLFLWLLRININSRKGILDDDPILYAIKDKFSYLLIFVIFILFYLSKF